MATRYPTRLMPRAFRATPILLGVLFVTHLLLARPVAAQVALNPGDTADFTTGTCATIRDVPLNLELGTTAAVDCDPDTRLLKAEVYVNNGLTFGFRESARAIASVYNDFSLVASPGTENHTVGAWISFFAAWRGFVGSIDIFNKVSVEVVAILDNLTTGQRLEIVAIHGRNENNFRTGLGAPIRLINIGVGAPDGGTVEHTFSAVLRRGHAYRFQIALECQVQALSGPIPPGFSACDFFDGFLGLGDGRVGSSASVKVGLDEEEILDAIAELRDHRHAYLTGRGVGHNNTTATTGPALFPSAP